MNVGVSKMHFKRTVVSWDRKTARGWIVLRLSCGHSLARRASVISANGQAPGAVACEFCMDEALRATAAPPAVTA